MLIAAWLGALAIGVSLGLLGSGGSILTVPVLVYLLGQDEKVAIAGSLAIVGGIALAGAIAYTRRRLVDWQSVIFFGIPGMAGSYAGAWVAKFVSGAFQLGLFAVVMLLAAVLMLRTPEAFRNGRGERHRWKIGLDGLVVGLVTGLVGVGGGFLIVPALVLLGGLPMQLAIGTSLMVIALKSASGFVKYLSVLAELGLHVDWQVIGLFTAIGTLGTFAGRAIATRMPHEALKRGFALFLVPVGIFILWQSVPQALSAGDVHQGSITRVLVRAVSHDAKVIGSGVGGAAITIRDAASGDTLVRGIQEGTTGDTERIMATPRERNATGYDSPGTAGFVAELALKEPTLVEISAEGPLGPPGPPGGLLPRASTTMLLIPGQDVLGEGVILDLHGFSVEILEPQEGESLPAGDSLRVRARVTMLCGCPTEPGGLWDSDPVEILARLVGPNGRPMAGVPLQYAGVSSTYAGSLPLSGTNAVDVEVLALDPERANFGFASRGIGSR